MARQKCDGRRKATRSAKVSSNRPKTYSSYGKSATHNILLRKSMVAINRGLSFRQAEEKFGISISTLHRYFNKIKDAVDDSSVASLYTVRKTISKASQKNQLLTSTEEDSIVKYFLFESARVFPISVRIMKSHIQIDQSHKTLMLTVCDIGAVLSSLLILEKFFPLLTEKEAEQLFSEQWKRLF